VLDHHLGGRQQARQVEQQSAETPRETIPSARVSSSRGQVTVRVPCATTASASIIYKIPLS
jgi:hypothetical protein